VDKNIFRTYALNELNLKNTKTKEGGFKRFLNALYVCTYIFDLKYIGNKKQTDSYFFLNMPVLVMLAIGAGMN
jgi:hypothetical protein